MRILRKEDVIGASIFKDGKLTQLMIIKDSKGRNNLKESISYPIYLLLKEVLGEYGIRLSGATKIGEYEVTAIAIDKYFRAENEHIIKELYSFTGGSVDIQFSGDGDCSYSFEYNLEDGSCIFKKHYLFSVVFTKKYDSFESMINEIRERSFGKRNLYWDQLLAEAK